MNSCLSTSWTLDLLLHLDLGNVDGSEEADENQVELCLGRPYEGTFFSEDTAVFVITPNRRTFFFPETEKLNFGD